MKTLRSRWTSETPLFWKQIRNTAWTVVVASASILLVNASLQCNLHHILIYILSYLIPAGISSGILAQLTVK